MAEAAFLALVIVGVACLVVAWRPRCRSVRAVRWHVVGEEHVYVDTLHSMREEERLRWLQRHFPEHRPRMGRVWL